MAEQVSVNLIIRDAHAGELDEVARLIVDSYRQYQQYLPPPRWQWYVEDMMNVRGRLDQSELIVAEEEGHLAGAVTLFLKGSKSALEGWPQGWASIRLLAVHPAFRSRGVGQALMDECVRRCRRLGVLTIGLHTTEYMEVARRMYERMGFKRAPEYDFHPEPGAVVMAYRLDL
jgi:ribosomal protein S18 acetylase RimI-like enzyme